jgi:hypothetical protein
MVRQHNVLYTWPHFPCGKMTELPVQQAVCVFPLFNLCTSGSILMKFTTNVITERQSNLKLRSETLRYTVSNLKYCTMFGHWWTPIVTCWVYRRHHSTCYTGLFPTLLVVITVFPVTLSSGPPIPYLGAVLWCLLSWMLAADSGWLLVADLTISVWVWVLCYDRRSVGQSVLV